MSIFKLPEMGEGVNEGELVRWLVKEGDVIIHDQPLVEMMTDKATVEIPSPSSGKVTKILAQEGQVVKVGAPLLEMEGGAPSEKAEQPKTPQRPASPERPAPVSAAAAPSAQRPTAPRAAAAPAGSVEIHPPPAGAHVLATPATRRYAREIGVDLNVIKGTGPVGRVTREDVMKMASGGMGAVAGQPAVRPTLIRPAVLPGQNTEERKPFRGIRRKIAENLVRSKQVIPHFTHVDEVDATELVAWRTKMKDEAAAHGVKLTYLPFIMKALVATCREFPQMNSSLDDSAGELIFKHYFNVGFAADTPEGLLVPNVKNVENKTILELAHEITDLAEKARAGKLAPDDMRNGTITITNIGSVGGIYATPIINHPEVAIIGVYEIQKKPVVINNEIKIREMMNLTATCDHRVVDGAQAARFMKKLGARLANPQSLLLEMV